jgi:hypothetical protein
VHVTERDDLSRISLGPYSLRREVKPTLKFPFPSNVSFFFDEIQPMRFESRLTRGMAVATPARRTVAMANITVEFPDYVEFEG